MLNCIISSRENRTDNQPAVPSPDKRVMKMCEANAYLRKPGEEEELLMEMVDRVYPQEDGLMMEDIFGRRKIVKAKIVELALVDHRIILEKE